ncbi:MAG: hypothetical protein IT300_18780 [Dehalococcoidia bacterium]|nr:hypothetical protein [Dehalococcoidia bacterium]
MQFSELLAQGPQRDFGDRLIRPLEAGSACPDYNPSEAEMRELARGTMANLAPVTVNVYLFPRRNP